MTYIDARIKGCGDSFETHDCITCSRNPWSKQCENYRHVMGLEVIYQE
jgi:hypothetical protein